MDQPPSLTIVPNDGMVHILDFGASPLYGPAFYEPLLQRGAATGIGFEPDPRAYGALCTRESAAERYFPYIIGDGARQTFYHCEQSGMSSIFPPNFGLLRHFDNFAEISRVVATEEVETKRLDDIPEIGEVDLLKMDVQGGELCVVRGAKKTFAGTTVIHTEALFVPMYESQPLFSDLDLALREQGFQIYRFVEVVNCYLRPFNESRVARFSDPKGGQLCWVDAVYIRQLGQIGELDSARLLRFCTVTHDLYRAWDVVHFALEIHDQQHNTQWSHRYLEWAATSARQSENG